MNFYSKNEERILEVLSSIGGNSEVFMVAMKKTMDNFATALERAAEAYQTSKQNEYTNHLTDAKRSFLLFEAQMKMLRNNRDISQPS